MGFLVTWFGLLLTLGMDMHSAKAVDPTKKTEYMRAVILLVSLCVCVVRVSAIGCNIHMHDGLYLAIHHKATLAINNLLVSTDAAPKSPSKPKPIILAPCAFFGVYDGHNGDYVAERLQAMLQKEFHTMLEAETKRLLALNGLSSLTSDTTKDNLYQNCLLDSVALMDRIIMDDDSARRDCILGKNTKDGGGSPTATTTGSSVGFLDTQSFAGSAYVK